MDMFFQFQKLNIFYQKEGAGKPVLLLHGWGGNHDGWYPITQQLKKEYAVYAVDLPGFGNSDMPLEDWSLENYARCVEAFIKQTIEKPVILIGHSFGGQIAIKVAYVSLSSITKLVLTDSAGIRNPYRIKNFFYLTMAKGGNLLFSFPPLKRFKQKAREKLYHHLNEHDYETAGKLKMVFQRIISEDIKNLLPNIACPTLLIWGENDRDTPLKDAQTMRKLLPDARLEIINDSGHFAYLERPQEFLEKVNEFIS